MTNEFTEEEREFMIAMFEQGKAERALKDAERALADARLNARCAYEVFMESKGVKP